MIRHVVDTTKYLEESISNFWEGIVIVDQNKLVIDGDNFLMLYLYVILKSNIPSIFAYLKVMEEFST